jgi:hypothetical protein
LPDKKNLYLISHQKQQPLLDLRAAGLLCDVEITKELFLGPYPPPTLSALKERSRIVNGLLELSQTAQSCD